MDASELDRPRAAPAADPPRLVFANQLRAVAAVSVMVSHLIGVFWLLRDPAAAAALSPAPPGPPPPIVRLVDLSWFEAGPFGVGLFFLISGLVVPISLGKHGAASFLAARALRIYPTYMAALCIQLLVLGAAGRYWEHPFPYDARAVLANLFLVHDLTGRPSIDLVNWTLTIELRFYLLVALLAPALRRARLAAVFVPATVVCALALLIAARVPVVSMHDTSRPIYTVSSELPFFVLMLMGVLFNYHVRGRLDRIGLLGGLALLGGMMAFAWWFSVLRGQFTHVLNNYVYALVVFGALYAVRARVRPNRVLDALAAISYPLYLVHALIGFVVMSALMNGAGVGYGPALVAAVLVAIGVASALHVLVETPSQRWGRRLANRGRERRGSPAMTDGSR